MAKLHLSSLAQASQIAIKQEADAEIDIDLIDVKVQVRRRFIGIEELAESVGQHGIMYPLIVHVQENGRYRLICGERRIRAARLKQLKSVPVLIKRGLTEAQIRALQVAENVDTDPLSAFDEVTGVAEDIEAYGAAEAAKIWNRKSAWISKRAGFKNFAPEVQELMVEGVCQDLEVLGSINQLKKSPGGEAYAKSVIAKFKRGESVSREGVRELVARVKAHEKAQAEAKEGKDLFKDSESTGSAKPKGGGTKKLHKVREELNKTGQTLADQFKAEQTLMTALGQPLQEGEWVLWSSFNAVVLPILDALTKERAATYLRRLANEIKSKSAEELYVELHGGEDIRSAADTTPSMAKGWEL